MQKRTFSISEIVLEKLQEVSDCFHIDKATLARLAVYHGLERIKPMIVFNEKTNKDEKEYRYLPVRNHHSRIKRKFEISLPDETWIEFANIMDGIEGGLEEHIPDGEMIELFIGIELRQFVLILDEYEKKESDDNEKIYRYGDTKSVSIEVDVPILLHEKLVEMQKKTGIKDLQIGKYIALSGNIHEYTQQNFDMLDSDADLLKEIKMLGLDRVKTMTLIRYLIKSNRIVWKNRD